MMSTIEWINQNTRRDTVVVGGKHWRGSWNCTWRMKGRYRFSDDPEVLAGALERQGKDVYLVRFEEDCSPTMFTIVEDGAIR